MLLFVFIVYFEQISHISVVSIVDFEQVNTGNFQKWAEKTNPGKTNIEGGELPKKGGPGQFADLRGGGLARKREGKKNTIFRGGGGGVKPQCTLWGG